MGVKFTDTNEHSPSIVQVASLAQAAQDNDGYVQQYSEDGNYHDTVVTRRKTLTGSVLNFIVTTRVGRNLWKKECKAEKAERHERWRMEEGRIKGDYKRDRREEWERRKCRRGVDNYLTR